MQLVLDGLLPFWDVPLDFAACVPFASFGEKVWLGVLSDRWVIKNIVLG